MGPCIVNIFKYNQQDATLYNGIYYYKCSTCFRRFLRPSSGAQNCIHSIGYLSRLFCFLPLSWVEFQLTHDSGKKQKKRFLRPSSGAQNCIHSIGYLSSFFRFLPLSWVSSNSLTTAVRSRKSGSSAHHQELKTVYTASGICRAFSDSYRHREWVQTHSR